METLDKYDSFSVIHALAYSFIGFQTALLGTKVPLFWDTACLIVNSGILEDEEYDDDDNTKVKGTNYAKNAQALGEICSKGIKVSLIDINRSGMIFEADTENNAILYGLKGVNRISRDDIEKIISNRPYTSIKDFITRCPLTKTKIISLIKAGAFDILDNDWASKICPNEPRKAIMAYYIYTVSELKNKLTLQNFNGLLTRNLIPDELAPCRKIFLLMQYLKKYKKGEYYLLSFEIVDLLQTLYKDILEHIEVINEIPCIKITTLKKIYDNIMSSAKVWLKNNEAQMLVKLNNLLFKEQWDKYALGSISSWEMEALCFYYHEHELSKVNFEKYGIVDFNSLPYDEIPIEKFYKRKNAQIPIYKTYRIVGTVIRKEVNKSLISLLTPTGVVSVKLTKDYFAMMNKQISEVGEDGKKHILEKSWFARGTKLMITGYRREDTFVGKTYSHTPTHQIYKILSVNEQGEMDLINEREKN